jgi:RNA ligase partner protein
MKHFSSIILDTSIFVNPDAYTKWNDKPFTALCSFIDKAQSKEMTLLTPPSIWEEIGHFINLDALPKTVSGYVRRKYPKKYEIPVPGLFLYELVEEMRIRINKGLRIAEKYAAKADVHEKSYEDLKKLLRNEYRTAMREGILDSRQDVDLLLLSRELALPIATADEGLKDWAHRLGLEYLDLDELKAYLFDTI